eukprot:1139994-Pelagomonas_calceolata.AAC.6
MQSLCRLQLLPSIQVLSSSINAPLVCTQLVRSRHGLRDFMNQAVVLGIAKLVVLFSRLDWKKRVTGKKEGRKKKEIDVGRVSLRAHILEVQEVHQIGISGGKNQMYSVLHHPKPAKENLTNCVRPSWLAQLSLFCSFVVGTSRHWSTTIFLFLGSLCKPGCVSSFQ